MEKPDDGKEYIWDDENQVWVPVIACVVEVTGVVFTDNLQNVSDLDLKSET